MSSRKVVVTGLRQEIIIIVIGVQVLITCAILLHVGEKIAPGVSLYKFTPLLGALLGSGLTLYATLVSNVDQQERFEPWYANERSGWIVIGLAQIAWIIGEGFWRYFSAIGQKPFPSIADAGYASFPALCFIGLLLQPNSGQKLQKTLVLLDSLIAAGALLAISWYLLLGSLIQSPGEDYLSKVLLMYYPTADAIILSCVVFLFLRGQSKLYQPVARRIGILILGLGLFLFASSDFIFNLQQSTNSYIDGTWVDLGWPLGMTTIGLAAYLRRFLPNTSPNLKEEGEKNRFRYIGFQPIQLLPYMLILLLFGVLVANVSSSSESQASIRLVLLLATIGVICLVLTRQILTLRENERLSHLQARSLQQIEDQARHIAERNKELEEGISHLKAVQTSLANGNLRARAHLKQGILWNLASSLNLLAERQASLGTAKQQLEHLRSALIDLGGAIERARSGQAFRLPTSCENVSEITPVIHALGFQRSAGQRPSPQNTPNVQERPGSGATKSIPTHPSQQHPPQKGSTYLTTDQKNPRPNY